MDNPKIKKKKIELNPCSWCGAETSALEIRHVNGTTRRIFRHPDNGCIMAPLLKDVPYSRSGSNIIIKCWNSKHMDPHDKRETIAYYVLIEKMLSVLDDVLPEVLDKLKDE